MGVLARLAKRIRRDGLRATLSALFTAGLRAELLCLYRLERLIIPLRPSSVEILSGFEPLRRLRMECTVTADEFYCDGRKGFEQCHLARCEGKPAGIIWTIKGRNVSRYIELHEDEAELSYLYVVPWARGRGIAKLLYASAASEQLRQGVSAIYAVIAEGNEPSRRAAVAVGFRCVACLRRPALWGPRFRPVPDVVLPAGEQWSGP